MTCAVATLFLLNVIAVSLFSLVPETEERFRRPRGCCQGCGYNLAGLESGSRCPECGREAAGEPVEERVRSIVAPRVSRRLMMMFVLVASLSLCYAGLVALGNTFSYMRLGYSFEVARNASRIRGFELAESVWVINPWPVMVVAAPWLTRMPDGKRFDRIWVGTLLGGFLLGAVWLMGACWFWTN